MSSQKCRGYTASEDARVKSVGDTRHRRTPGSKVSGIHGLGGCPSQKCRGYTASEDARVKSVGDTRHRRTPESKVSGIHGIGGRPSQKCRGYMALKDARVKPRDDTSTRDTPDYISIHTCFGTWPPTISIDGSTHTTPDH